MSSSPLSFFDPVRNLEACREVFSLMSRRRQLVWEMTKREFSDRYAGQVGGVLWAVGHPVILMAIYVTVFLVIYPSKFGGSAAFPMDAATYMLSGIIPWIVVQDSINKSATVITGNASLVKQVIFPIEVLPIKTVLAASLTQVIATFLLMLYVWGRHGALPWTYALLPLIFLFQIMAMTGISFILAVVGAYFRDLKEFVQVFCTMGMFITPIFFLPTLNMHWFFKLVFWLNPISYMVWCYQDVCYYGRFEHPLAWIVFIPGSFWLFCTGYRVFKKLKIMLGNVL